MEFGELGTSQVKVVGLRTSDKSLDRASACPSCSSPGCIAPEAGFSKRRLSPVLPTWCCTWPWAKSGTELVEQLGGPLSGMVFLMENVGLSLTLALLL